MNKEENLSYTKKTSFFYVLGSVLILLFCIFFFKTWKILGLNILFIGYFIFSNLGFATVLYAVFIRVILYPTALIKNYLEARIKKTEEKFNKINGLSNRLERDRQKQKLLQSNKLLLLFSWFHLCFMTMNAVAIGAIFFQGFDQERLERLLYADFYTPDNYPINTLSKIPFLGIVDLAKPNLTLNLYGAIGAAVLGLTEIIMNKRTSKRQLLKYLVLFPAGAYYLTYWVPSGFEYALLIFEILTIFIIIGERIAKTKVFKMVTGKEDKQEKEKPDDEKKAKDKKQNKQDDSAKTKGTDKEKPELNKDTVKGLIRDVIAEASQKDSEN